MCGIAGVVDLRLAGSPEQLKRHGRTMAAALAHRGPDGEGVWLDADAGAVLAHRRLAVVDLTPSGVQPMLSADGRWAVTYNGELYNTEDLRGELAQAGVRFRGTSDTEVLIEAVARWGLDRAIAAANGMFAAAFFDRHARVLHLVRDRLGIKPLYWTNAGGRIAFASELSALAAVAEPALTINQDAVASLTMLGYVIGPQSIWHGVRQVAPGTIVALEPHKGAAVATYWSLAKAAGEGLASPLRGGDEEVVEAAASLLADAVRRQLVSDVPIGAFLSGGIDSTSVVALMQAASSRPVKTFTIGFADRSLDEAQHAAAVARHLGTEHTTLEATEAEALAIVPRLAEIYDEPFADSSQIPTALVSALTRKHVTVALSGDGGDEVFAGYNRHRFAAGIGRSLQAWPAAVRHLMAAVLSGRITAGAAAMSSRLLPAVLPSQLDDKLRKLADVLRYDETDGYCRLVSQAAAVDEVAAVPAAFERAIGLPPQLASSLDALGRMQLRDAMTYLPGDVLTKVDRAAMAVALEVRVPLLDHRVVEFAWRLPASMRVRKGATKWLLRRVLERSVPSHLVERPKQGFAVPLAAWLRGPLREWAEDLLCGVDFGGGYLERAPARMLWNDCLAGRTGCEYAIWPLLMFESWRLRHATRPQRHVA